MPSSRPSLWTNRYRADVPPQETVATFLVGYLLLQLGILALQALNLAELFLFFADAGHFLALVSHCLSLTIFFTPA